MAIVRYFFIPGFGMVAQTDERDFFIPDYGMLNKGPTVSTTVVPTTIAPTTIAPTAAPTTLSPTSLAPTTLLPTLAPTTIAPTLAPTSLAPTSLTPTTEPPEVFGPFDDYDDDGHFDINTNVRFIIPSSELKKSGNLITVKLAYKSNNWSFSSLYIGHQAASGDLYDFDGGQRRVRFGGLNSGTVGPGGLTSDTLFFNLDKNKNLILAFYFSAPQDYVPVKTTSTGYDLYYKVGVDESAITNVSDYIRDAEYYLRRFVSLITAYRAATTPAPTTAVPTPAPTSLAPTTLEPTVAPTTVAPTLAPTTLQPTEAPTTLAPTTLRPTTIAPTTIVVTTFGPTTAVIFTTKAPTTPASTTLAPTTPVPTTSRPTTRPPTTLAPPTTEGWICVREFISEILLSGSDESEILPSVSAISEIIQEVSYSGDICW